MLNRLTDKHLDRLSLTALTPASFTQCRRCRAGPYNASQTSSLAKRDLRHGRLWYHPECLRSTWTPVWPIGYGLHGVPALTPLSAQAVHTLSRDDNSRCVNELTE